MHRERHWLLGLQLAGLSGDEAVEASYWTTSVRLLKEERGVAIFLQYEMAILIHLITT